MVAGVIVTLHALTLMCQVGGRWEPSDNMLAVFAGEAEVLGEFMPPFQYAR